MVTAHVLKKVLKTNVTYEMEKDRYYVIKKIGTDATSKVTVKVDGIPVLDIFDTIAPLAKTSSNLLGPIDLNEYFIVVPPERKLLFESEASAKVYIEGDLIVLSPGEAVPAEHLARYNTYATRKISYIDTSITMGSVWPAGQEVKVVDITPPTIEDWIFDGFAGAQYIGVGPGIPPGNVGIKLYYDGKPLDLLVATAGPHGIDISKMPLPPTADKEFEAFTFKEKPITVVGGHTLTVTAINVSGEDIDLGGAGNITVRFVAVYKRLIKG